MASINPTQGNSFGGTVATITDAYAGTTVPASDLSASITWDDGTTTGETITASGGGVYSVAATHTFHRAGSRAVAVSVTGPGRRTATDTQNVSINSAGLNAYQWYFDATEGSADSGHVGLFRDNDFATTSPPSDYSADHHLGQRDHECRDDYFGGVRWVLLH